MGLFRKTETITNVDKRSTLIAQYDPQVLSTPLLTSLVPAMSMSRELALEVPSVARARNLICATIAAMPLELYR